METTPKKPYRKPVLIKINYAIRNVDSLDNETVREEILRAIRQAKDTEDRLIDSEAPGQRNVTSGTEEFNQS